MIQWSFWGNYLHHFEFFFNKVSWFCSTCFFMVIMPFDLWQATRPFQHECTRLRFLDFNISSTPHDLILKQIH